MKTRFLLPLLLLGVLVAGCGGGGGGSAKLLPNDVAVVGSQHVPKSMFDEVMGYARHNLKVNHQSFPKAGTTAYANIRSQAVTLLVQEAEKENEAAKLGITVTEKDIDTRLAAIKKQYFAGSEKRYKQQLKTDELTEQEVRDQIKANLVAQKLFDKLTKDATVTKTAIAAYYVQHQSDYQKPASRAVQYILVGKAQASLAGSLFTQLKGGGDWCALAKKYSKDPSSSGNCGKASFSQGQTVAEFDKLLFSLPTGQVGKVNTTQYGWFVLKPTAKATKASRTPVAVAGKQIQATLLQNKKNDLMNAWIGKIQKDYCSGSKIKYQPGYKPSPDPCTVTSTTSTTG